MKKQDSLRKESQPPENIIVHENYSNLDRYKKKIKYKKGYKYQLQETYSHKIKDLIGDVFYPYQVNDYIEFDYNSSDCLEIIIKKGYCWDGPSGPTIDTKNFMRGSLVHDALYQLMREKVINKRHRKYADELLRKICLEDGMCWFRAWYVYWSVRLFAKSAASPKNIKKIFEV